MCHPCFHSLFRNVKPINGRMEVRLFVLTVVTAIHELFMEAMPIIVLRPATVLSLHYIVKLTTRTYVSVQYTKVRLSNLTQLIIAKLATKQVVATTSYAISVGTTESCVCQCLLIMIAREVSGSSRHGAFLPLCKWKGLSVRPRRIISCVSVTLVSLKSREDLKPLQLRRH